MGVGEQRKCRGCDVVFTVKPHGNGRVWCTMACCNRTKRATGQKPKAPPKPFWTIWYGTCEICGQLWCGQKTSHKASTCQRDVCRKEYKNRHSRARYATDPTKDVERARLQRATRTDEERAREAQRVKTWWSQFPEATCAACGQPAGKPERKDRRQACSNACRYALMPPRIPKPKPPKPPRPTWQRTCQRCGVAFETDISIQVHCTKRCAAKARSERRKIAKRQTGSVIGRVYRAVVFARDDYVCWLCDYPTNPNAKVPDVEAPTIDHVIPLAKGGAHTMDNVRTAHFICNAYKRDLAM